MIVYEAGRTCDFCDGDVVWTVYAPDPIVVCVEHVTDYLNPREASPAAPV